MKIVIVIIFYLFMCLLPGRCSNIYASNYTKFAENLFRQNVNIDGQILFTYVPRGLIVSIEEAVFFDEGNDKLKQSSLTLLDEIGNVLNNLDNDFVIEGHTEDINFENLVCSSNWEMSLVRANNITKYLIRCAKVPPQKIFTVGFGEFMPFSSNVSSSANLDKRIDFVILDYEASR